MIEKFKNVFRPKSPHIGEQAAALTETLIFLKREVIAQAREIQDLEKRIAAFASVDFDPTINNKEREQNRILNQIDIIDLSLTKEIYDDNNFKIKNFQGKLDEIKRVD